LEKGGDRVIKLYTYSSCTSCRKARDILIQHHIPFVEKNMKTQGIEKEEILQLLSVTSNGTTDVISTRSQDLKKLNINMDELTLNEWIELVQHHPGILRRPLLLTSNQLIVGYNKDEYDGLLKKVKLIKKKYIFPNQHHSYAL
jgi:regulatory protein spx